MMPAITASIPVTGTIASTPSGRQFVLSHKLTGIDTFLSGVLEIAGQRVRVRILTLDDVTVLRPDEPVATGGSVATEDGPWTGELHVSHGQRPGTVPDDLQEAARRARRDITSLDEADRRYALTFLGEATTAEIRAARIDVIVDALPPRRPRLISLDVGGTLGEGSGPGITSALIAASPCPAPEVRKIVREILHTASDVTEVLVASICAELQVPRHAFPDPQARPAPFQPYPHALEALVHLSGLGTVVTLSNAARAESSTEEMDNLFGSWIDDFFPSWKIGYSKPDPRAFRAVAERYEVDTSEVLHIGDDWACDVVGAIEAGAQAVWLSKGRITPDPALAAAGQVQIVRDLSEVPSLILHFDRSSR
jgi:HAD superfamily hydrolase (TIGR01509 family)